jgi:hypothetical protein
MTAVTESDLKELKDLINTRFDKLSENITDIKEDITDLKVGLGKIESKTEGLEKRVDDINGQLNIMTIGFLSIVGVLVTAILGMLGKLVFFPILKHNFRSTIILQKEIIKNI